MIENSTNHVDKCQTCKLTFKNTLNVKKIQVKSQWEVSKLE